MSSKRFQKLLYFWNTKTQAEKLRKIKERILLFLNSEWENNMWLLSIGLFSDFGIFQCKPIFVF